MTKIKELNYTNTTANVNANANTHGQRGERTHSEVRGEMRDKATDEVKKIEKNQMLLVVILFYFFSFGLFSVLIHTAFG